MRTRCAAVLAALTLIAVGCDDGRREQRVVVGVGSTTEQRLLASLTAQVLDDAGMVAEVRGNLGGTVGLRREALGGEIDLFWDYTGAAWVLGMGQQAPPADPEESYERVRRADEDNGLSWLAPSAANATLALFVRSEELPGGDRPRGLGWLAGVLSAGDEHLCADPEFVSRAGGLDALATAYAMDLERLTDAAIPADEEQAVQGVATRRCFAALATATSGEAPAAGLVRVRDELRVFPAFIVAPVVRTARLEQLPALAPALERLTAVLDTERLAELNAAVEQGREPDAVAEDFLDEVGLGG